MVLVSGILSLLSGSVIQIISQLPEAGIVGFNIYYFKGGIVDLRC